jgi:hypothetical protein
LDNRQAIIHYLGWKQCDPRPLMDRLSDRHHVVVMMHDLSLPDAKSDGEEEATSCGAGSGGCGSCQLGKCATCSSHRPILPPQTPPVDHCDSVGVA